MGKKIICESCGTIFPFEQAKDFTVCPVCNASFDDREDDATSVHGENPKTDDGHSDWITWYYYGYKSDNGKTACLEDSPIDLTQHGDTFFLIKEFKAPPRDAKGSSDKAKEILRTYIPDAFSESKTKETSVNCPWCGSTEYTLLNRGYSIWTGFLGSGKVKRVCNRCKKEF